MDIVAMIVAMATTIITSTIMVIISISLNRKEKTREKLELEREKREERNQAEYKKRAEDRKQESILGLEVTEAIGELTFATAMAVKNGHTNGEMTEAVKKYKEASDKVDCFLRSVAEEHLNK